MNYKHWLICLAIIAAIVVTWFQLRPTEQQRIRKQLLHLAETINKNPQEGNAAHAMKMLALGNLLCENVTIELQDFPYNGENSAETLVSLASRGRTVFNNISLQLLEQEIILTTPERAQARCVWKVNLASSAYNDSNIRHVLMQLQKVDDKWLLEQVLDDDILKK